MFPLLMRETRIKYLNINTEKRGWGFESTEGSWVGITKDILCTKYHFSIPFAKKSPHIKSGELISV